MLFHAFWLIYTNKELDSHANHESLKKRVGRTQVKNKYNFHNVLKVLYFRTLILYLIYEKWFFSTSKDKLKII